MPKWEDCAKIHEGCGGLVRWVEAIRTPGVGYKGECTACGVEELVVEEIIPIEDYRPRDLYSVPPSELASLEWNEAVDWEANQDRLSSEVAVDV